MNQIDAAQFHRDSIIVDGLNASNFYEPRIFNRLHQGGVTAVNATIAAWHSLPETMKIIGDMLHAFEQYDELIMPVRHAADIQKAKASNRVGIIFGFQDTAPIGDNLRLLSVYQALGVRIIQLTYNHTNRVGSGNLVPNDEGLTPFGREVVAEMNRLGILVDVSHCGPRTTLDAIEASSKPIAFTHANPLALCQHPRNKSDDALKALAAKGGVVGVVVFPPLLTCSGQATVDDYVAAIDYLVNLIGIEHVGLGPDFMEEMTPEIAAQALRGMSPHALAAFTAVKPTAGFESIAACGNVTAALLAHGYSADDVKKIMGGNWLRLYQEVW
ncbi:MAG: membrane dipeptidase [Chloroflexi bacterium]|nr:membrane dipeptidase [Chloroflexota bacterium]